MTPNHYHDHVDDPVAAGQRLREARLRANLSQRQLAFKGCSAAYISRLEAGDRVPSMQLATKLAERLNVSLAWLLVGIEKVTLTLDERQIDAILSRSGTSWRDLTEEDRREAVQLMREAAFNAVRLYGEALHPIGAVTSP